MAPVEGAPPLRFEGRGERRIDITGGPLRKGFRHKPIFGPMLNVGEGGCAGFLEQTVGLTLQLLEGGAVGPTKHGVPTSGTY